MVPGEGFEPTRITPADFKSAASASSATPALKYFTLMSQGYSNKNSMSSFLVIVGQWERAAYSEDLFVGPDEVRGSNRVAPGWR